MNDLHGIIFAYRANPELRELTQHRNTCSIPYGGRYRIIDFILSSLVHARLTDVGELAVGKKADLLLLDRELRLKAVFIDGKKLTI